MAIGYQLSALSCQLSAISKSLVARRRRLQLSAVSSPLSAVSSWLAANGVSCCENVLTVEEQRHSIAGMSRQTTTERLIELQREYMEIQQLLEGKLSEATRPAMEELLQLVVDEIQRERQKMIARGQGAA
jgi:hypothetical protein